jgi:CHASE3 domain sensor protein
MKKKAMNQGRMMTLKSRKRLSIGLLLISIIVLMLSGMWVYSLYQSAFSENIEVVKSFQTVRAANRTQLAIDEVDLNISSFLITHENSSIQKLAESIITIQLNIRTLAQLTQDDPTEIQILNKLQPLIDNKIKFLNELQSNYVANQNNTSVNLISDPNRLPLSAQIISNLAALRNIEISQLDEATPRYELNINTANRYFCVLGILNIFLLLLTFFIARPLFD